MTLKSVAYFFLALSFCLIVPILFRDLAQLGFWIACFISLIVYIFLNVLLNSNNKSKKQSELDQQIEDLIKEENKTLEKYKKESVRYCRDLIEYYKRSQEFARTGYYCVQLLTIILSGLTPILIVIQNNNQLILGLGELKSVITWLSILFPALASILATISTSIPLQQNWISSKLTREKLEAELEAFLLGAGDLYHVVEEQDPLFKQRQVIEKFIISTNQIHLQQQTQWADLQLKYSAQAEEARKVKEKEAFDKAQQGVLKAKGEADKAQQEVLKAKGEADKAQQEVLKAKEELDKALLEATKAQEEFDKADASKKDDAMKKLNDATTKKDDATKKWNEANKKFDDATKKAQEAAKKLNS